MRLYQIDTSTEQRSYFLPTEELRSYYSTCHNCGWPIEINDRSKSLRWQGGADPGDIVAGLAGTFARRSAALTLQGRFPELKLLDTTIVNRSSALVAADKVRGRPSMYTGEDVSELRATIRIPLSPDRCTLKARDKWVDCPVCHRTVGYLDGVQEKPDIGRNPAGTLPGPRLHGKGVFLFEHELAAHNFFFLGGFLKLFCTEDVKRFIDEQGFTNAGLLEVGETVKSGENVPIQFD